MYISTFGTDLRLIYGLLTNTHVELSLPNFVKSFTTVDL